MTYTEFKGMDKKAAGVWPWLVSGAQGLKDIGVNTAVLLLAAGASVGGTAGYLGAKLNAKDKQDIDTIKKEYENERLKSDLGYLSAKTNQEYNAAVNKQAPKAARIFG